MQTGMQGLCPPPQQADSSPTPSWAAEPNTQEGCIVLQWVCHQHTRHGFRANPARASPTYQCTPGSLPCHNRGLHTAHIGGTPRAYSSGDQRGVCCWDPQFVSHIRRLLQDWKTQLTYLIHKQRELNKNEETEKYIPNDGTRQKPQKKN